MNEETKPTVKRFTIHLSIFDQYKEQTVLRETIEAASLSQAADKIKEFALKFKRTN
jgi:hypothetical protein